jgi:hypothetical protein
MGNRQIIGAPFVSTVQTIQEVDSDFSMDLLDDLVDVVGGGPNVNITLPQNPVAGRRHRILASASAVTLVGGAYPIVNPGNILAATYPISLGSGVDVTFSGLGQWIPTGQIAASVDQFLFAGRTSTAGSPQVNFLANMGVGPAFIAPVIRPGYPLAKTRTLSVLSVKYIGGFAAGQSQTMDVVVLKDGVTVAGSLVHFNEHTDPPGTIKTATFAPTTYLGAPTPNQLDVQTTNSADAIMPVDVSAVVG